jgi:hypothetical protein
LWPFPVSHCHFHGRPGYFSGRLDPTRIAAAANSAAAMPKRGRTSILSDNRIMIDLYNDATGELIGTITEADLKVLTDALEEESTEDRDYYIDRATLDVVGDGRATDHLMKLLRDALGANDGIDVRWERR